MCGLRADAASSDCSLYFIVLKQQHQAASVGLIYVLPLFPTFFMKVLRVGHSGFGGEEGVKIQ